MKVTSGMSPVIRAVIPQSRTSRGRTAYVAAARNCALAGVKAFGDVTPESSAVVPHLPTSGCDHASAFKES